MLENVKDAPVKARASLGGWWHDAREFLSEVRNEMKRVTWPRVTRPREEPMGRPVAGSPTWAK